MLCGMSRGRSLFLDSVVHRLRTRRSWGAAGYAGRVAGELRHPNQRYQLPSVKAKPPAFVATNYDSPILLSVRPEVLVNLMRFLDSTARLIDGFSDVGPPMWHVFSSSQRYFGRFMTGHYRLLRGGQALNGTGREAWKDKNQATLGGPACSAPGLSRRIEQGTSKSSACLSGELNPSKRITGRITEDRRRIHAVARRMHQLWVVF